MAKKNRKKKKRQQVQYSAAELTERLGNALSESRVRLAYSTARELLSHNNLSSVQLKMACKALEIKIIQMHRQGDYSQISVMRNSFCKKSPDLDEQIAPEVKILVEWYGQGKNVFARYDNDISVKNSLDSYISNIMNDPTELTECSILPDSHELKRTAVLLLTAWEKVERGQSENPELNELATAIGRHSPFIAWRLFICGLDFLYRGETNQASAHFSRISPASPLHSVAESLNRVISKQPAVSQIDADITSAVTECDMRVLAENLDALLSNPRLSANKAYDAFSELFTRDFYRDRPVLYINMMALSILKYESNSFPRLLELMNQHDTPGRELALLICDYVTQQASPDLWRRFLDNESSLTPMKKSLICDWIATTLSTRFRPPETPMWYNGPLRVNMKMGREMYDSTLLPFWQQGQQEYPLAESYSKWYSIAEFYCTPAQSDKILLDWNRDFPDDEEVLYKLVESCRARKVLTKAEGYISRLNQLVAGQPRLERLKQFVTMEKAVKFLAGGKIDKARACVEKMAAPTETFAGSLLRCIKYVIGCVDKDSGADKQILRHNHPVMDGLSLNQLRGEKIRLKYKIIEKLEELSRNAELYFSDIDMIFSYKDNIWNGNDLSVVIIPDQLENMEKVDSELIWNVCRHFLKLSTQYKFGSRILRLLWDISGEGIRRRDKYTTKFLLLRGIVCFWLSDLVDYCSQHLVQEKGGMALALAEKLAKKTDDSETIRYVDEFIYSLSIRPDVFDEQQKTFCRSKVEKIIEGEINSQFSSYFSLSRTVPDCQKQENKLPPELISNWNIYSPGVRDEFYDEDEDREDEDDWDAEWEEAYMDDDYFPETPAREEMVSQMRAQYESMAEANPDLSDEEIQKILLNELMSSLVEWAENEGIS